MQFCLGHHKWGALAPRISGRSTAAWTVGTGADGAKMPDELFYSSATIASASISRSISGETRAVIPTIVQTGRMLPNTSP